MTNPEHVSPAPDVAAARLQACDLASGLVGPVSFLLAKGQCLCVTGPSGAGKTRLLRLLADLDEGRGEVFLDGVARSAFTAPQWRARVLYQAAESSWWLPSVIAHFRPEQHDEAVQLASRLGLGAERLAADVTQLSTGERQRALLVRSLLKKPDVLLLDEPSSALDAGNVARMEALLLEKMQGGLAMLLVTHSREQETRLADGAIALEKR
ncbi:ABC transporter ATP-binding protein [Herbaspirillum robiniae]|uniref:ATP-binding cassette domain-containing protein n=1 Tax=Herbaspirillum robiniae TaxID=2014887 RepID=A0ABX2M297_9BURK|nr:ATP-binding cassette domain-containing protein [Herbaspirillum robiniae]NUU02371.1 ATP-binding cassette domain-containing protein [Herbaspirillum robiniae]